MLAGVEEGKARQTAGKGAEATSEALENVWIDNESRWALCIQQAADLFSRSLFSAGPGIEAKGELRSEPWEGASRARGQSALARALECRPIEVFLKFSRVVGSC